MGYRVVVQVFDDKGSVLDEDDGGYLNVNSDIQARNMFDDLISETHKDSGLKHRGQPYKVFLVDDGGQRITEHSGIVP